MTTPDGTNRTDLIQVPFAPLESSEAVDADIDAVVAQDGPLRDRRDIEPLTARIIASWYQSPGAIGHVLAGFASGAPVDRTALLDDITATVNLMDNGQTDWWPQELNLLATFVINYQKEQRP